MPVMMLQNFLASIKVYLSVNIIEATQLDDVITLNGIVFKKSKNTTHLNKSQNSTAFQLAFS